MSSSCCQYVKIDFGDEHVKIHLLFKQKHFALLEELKQVSPVKVFSPDNNRYLQEIPIQVYAKL